MTIRSFRQFKALTRSYPSSSFEETEGTVWIQCQAHRHFNMLETFGRHRGLLGGGPISVVDLGAFPGTLLKCLRLYCREEGRLVGIGLEGPEAFVEHLEAFRIEFLRANLDPIVRTADPLVEALPRRMPLDDGAFDAAFCTEALEHMLDPMYALREIHRVLRPGGLFLTTTPNLARLANRIKLALFGHSINYPLRDSVPYGLTNWRPHMREYTMSEFTTLVAEAGFEILEQKYVDVNEDDDRLFRNSSTLRLRLMKKALKVLTLRPSFRHILMLMLRKPA